MINRRILRFFLSNSFNLLKQFNICFIKCFYNYFGGLLRVALLLGTEPTGAREAKHVREAATGSTSCATETASAAETTTTVLIIVRVKERPKRIAVAEEHFECFIRVARPRL